MRLAARDSDRWRPHQLRHRKTSLGRNLQSMPCRAGKRWSCSTGLATSHPHKTQFVSTLRPSLPSPPLFRLHAITDCIVRTSDQNFVLAPSSFSIDNRRGPYCIWSCKGSSPPFSFARRVLKAGFRGRVQLASDGCVTLAVALSRYWVLVPAGKSMPQPFQPLLQRSSMARRMPINAAMQLAPSGAGFRKRLRL